MDNVHYCSPSVNCAWFRRSLLMVITVFVHLADARKRSDSSHTISDDGRDRSAIFCYSCMSNFYNDNWHVVKDLYYRPLSYTNDCNDPFQRADIPVEVCNGHCVILIERVYFSGRVWQTQFIRGCINRVAMQGIRNQTLHEYHLDSHQKRCRRIPRKQLFAAKSEPTSESPDIVGICTCLNNRCNDDSGAASTFRFRLCGLFSFGYEKVSLLAFIFLVHFSIS